MNEIQNNRPCILMAVGDITQEDCDKMKMIAESGVDIMLVQDHNFEKALEILKQSRKNINDRKLELYLQDYTPDPTDAEVMDGAFLVQTKWKSWYVARRAFKQGGTGECWQINTNGNKQYLNLDSVVKCAKLPI